MTPEQARVLRALVRLMDAHGGATPSFRALGRALDLAHSRVHTQVQALERDGWIRRDNPPHCCLSVTILRRPPPGGADQPRVYLSSPYSLRRDRTVAEEEAREAAEMLMRLNVAAFSPLVHGAGVARSAPAIRDGWRHEDWMRWCLPWLHASDIVVVLSARGWEQSAGVRQEIEAAEAANIPVLHWDRVTTSAGWIADQIRRVLCDRLALPMPEQSAAA